MEYLSVHRSISAQLMHFLCFHGQFRRVTRGGGEGDLLCLFSEIGKPAPIFGNKCFDYGHLWVKFLLKGAIFKSLQDK